MQAIQTRYIGPTNHRGSRVKVYSEGFPRGIVVSWDHSLNPEGNFRAAAVAFIRAKGWFGVWVEGGSADGRGSTFVCVTRERVPNDARIARIRSVLESSGADVIAVLPDPATGPTFNVQGHYGQGWETVTAESTRSEALERLREYRANEPGVPFRVRKEV